MSRTDALQGFHHAHDLISAHSGAVGELRSTHAMALSGEAPEWVQLLPLGKFSGRDGRGPYVIASKEAAKKIIEQTLALAIDGELVIDYDHQSDFAAKQGVGGTAKASAWIKTLEARDDGIWGRVEWTGPGAAAVQAKEYRYLSPVFAHTKTGEVTCILRAGLTNNPNLSLVAIASANPNIEGTMDFIAKLRKALGLPETTSEEAVLAHASRLNTHSTSFIALATAAGVTLDDKAETITAACSALGAKLKGFDDAAKAAGLKADDKPEQLVVAINAKTGGVVDPAKFVPVEQVVALQSQLNTLQASINGDKAEAAVDAAIQAGKLVPALRDWGLSLHSKSPDEFKKFVDAAPVVLKPGTDTVVTQQAVGTDGLTEDERAICSQMGISPVDYLKNKSKEA
ncbi:MAG: phage protease [Parvibaculum sedimenti]|uniref:phage protease n=1 Tax=Parvibaculum sedimenti TaxID=2608632 RepID=UPI003BB6C8CB